MSSVMDRISACGIVPVIQLFRAPTRRCRLGCALLKGSIDVMEITFPFDDAACASIRKVCEELRRFWQARYGDDV